jgi:hypothetical protein
MDWHVPADEAVGDLARHEPATPGRSSEGRVGSAERRRARREHPVQELREDQRVTKHEARDHPGEGTARHQLVQYRRSVTSERASPP